MIACRDDGRCQYAIDHGAEGMGFCPQGKCVMPGPAGVAEAMPGTSGFTMAVFRAEDVPVGTKLYIHSKEEA